MQFMKDTKQFAQDAADCKYQALRDAKDPFFGGNPLVLADIQRQMYELCMESKGYRKK